MGWVVPPACLDLLGVFGKPMLLDPDSTIFVQLSLWSNRNRVAMGQLSQGSGLSGNVVHVTAALFETLMSESSFGNVYSHMRRDPRDS